MSEQFIERGRHRSGFSALSNRIWEDEKLSVEAKGTLGYLLSRPPNWRVRITQVGRKLKIGRDKLYRIMNECIDAGYVERRQGRSHGAFKPVTYYVRDVASLPHTDLPEAAEPDTANQEALVKKEKTTRTEKKQIASLPPAPPPRESRAREAGEVAAEVLAPLSVASRAHPGWRGLSAWVERLLCNGVERVDIVVGIAQCLRSLKDQPPSTFGYFTAAIERARAARTAPLPGVKLPQPAQHGMGAAGEILRKKLGEVAFASWFAGTRADVFCGTVTLSVPTRFKRSYILANFELACIAAFSAACPDVERLAVVVEAKAKEPA